MLVEQLGIDCAQAEKEDGEGKDDTNTEADTPDAIAQCPLVGGEDDETDESGADKATDDGYVGREGDEKTATAAQTGVSVL